eukprot:8895796-Lingulodinium_polyedra.AAC.1
MAKNAISIPWWHLSPWVSRGKPENQRNWKQRCFARPMASGKSEITVSRPPRDVGENGKAGNIWK